MTRERLYGWVTGDSLLDFQDSTGEEIGPAMIPVEHHFPGALVSFCGRGGADFTYLSNQESCS